MPEKLFFYGTLCHISLLEIVLGRPLNRADVHDASLHGFGAFGQDGQAFPTLKSGEGLCADGLLVTGLTIDDIARLNFYESGFDFDLREVPVRTTHGDVVTRVYFPAEPISACEVPWTVQDWQAGWADLSCLAAAEAMSYFGEISAQTLAERLPSIRRRAASVVRARQMPEMPSFGAQYSREDVNISHNSRPYTNFYQMQEFMLKFRKHSGEMSNEMQRAAFVGFDVAVVLPYDPVTDQVLLVEQFRLGPFAHGAARPWTLEPVCGHVDAGETPEQAARREAGEEAGLKLGDLLPISCAYPSPGCSTELYYSYLGLCDLSQMGGGIGGLDCEEEDIRRYVITFDELMAFVDGGGANNLVLVMAANWLARKREGLRKGA